jgi:hypothetical protein
MDEKGIKSEKTETYVYRCIPGKIWNPLRRYPKNQNCFCGSLLKAKKCCLPHLTEAVSKEFAAEITKDWDKILKRELTFPQAPKTQKRPTFR